MNEQDNIHINVIDRKTAVLVLKAMVTIVVISSLSILISTFILFKSIDRRMNTIENFYNEQRLQAIKHDSLQIINVLKKFYDKR
jgi:hypothetical protein